MFIKSEVKQRSRGGRARRGFTMAEILATILIMMIIFAVAAPNVVKVQRDMRMTELDAKAEQVYNAVQFRLSNMKAAGKLALTGADGVFSAIEANRAAPSDYGTVVAAAQKAGYTSTPGKDTIRYAVKGDAAAEQLLGQDTAGITRAVTDGSYVIEFSPSTGEVYAVFYWDDWATAAGSADPKLENVPGRMLYYDAVKDHREDWHEAGSFRAEHHVGYYNGVQVADHYIKEASDEPDDSGGSVPPVIPGVTPSHFDPAGTGVSIENKEELYVKVGNSSFAAADFDPSKLQVEVTVTQKLNSGQARMVITKDGSQLGYRNGDQEIDLILDSMYKDDNGRVLSFQNLIDDNGAGNQGFVFGANFDITAKVTYDGQPMPSVTTTVNSAFDKLDRSDMQWGIVEVKSLRQLQNISTAQYDWNYSSYNEIRLTGDIDFDGTQWDDENVAVIHRDRQNLNPLYDEATGEYRPMESITLPDNFNNSNARMINGEGHSIKNVYIESTYDNLDQAEDNRATGTGVFQNLGVRLTNITFENAHVKGVKNVGVIAGYMQTNGVVLSNCYVLGGRVEGQENVGGIMGCADGPQFENCATSIDVYAPEADNVGGFVGKAKGATMVLDCQVLPEFDANGTPEIKTVTGRDNVGGFAGSLMLGNAGERCDARVNVVGVNNVGGFAGLAEKQMKESVASGVFDIQGNVAYPVTVSGSGDNIGGFYGASGANAETEDCLAMVNVEGTGASSSRVGGFVGFNCVQGQWGASSSPFLRCAVRGEPAITSDNDGDGVADGVLHVTSTGSAVGGFAGELRGGAARLCYAAIDVYASSAASGGCFDYGGFAGLQSSAPTVKNCYSSGAVVANYNVGGFYGRVAGSNEIQNCYSTSDVSAYDNAGGFVGFVEGGNEWSWGQGAYSYGEVSRIDGSSASVGGFFGAANVNMQWKNFKFLKDEGYNDDLGNDVGGASYQVLAVGTASASQSHPYSYSLRGAAFPFPLISADDTTLEHYGDWSVL